MHRATVWLICGALLLGISHPLSGQTISPGRTAVLSHVAGSPSPSATLDAVRWLEGAWEGELEGMKQQHIVFPPTPGHMPAFVRAWDANGKVFFYEIGVIAEVAGSLEIRVKHFTPELAGWEDRDAYVRRPLVALTGEALYFDGITYVKDGPDRHSVYFRIPDGDRRGEIIVVKQSRMRWPATAGAGSIPLPTPPNPAP